MTAQAAQANDKSSNWDESTIKVCMGTKQFCSRSTNSNVLWIKSTCTVAVCFFGCLSAPQVNLK